MNAALIIASGTTDTSGQFQPMQPVGLLTAVQRLIIVFQQAGVERIVVAAGPEADKLEKHVARMGVVSLRGPEGTPAEMLDNVKLGLAYLQGKCSAAFITPVDVPLFSPETVRLLSGVKQPAAAPAHSGVHGHPLLLAARLFPAVLRYKGNGGLKGALAQSGASVEYLEVPDEGVVLDVSRQDFAHLLARHSLRRLHPEAKLSLARETRFYGPGAQQLFQLVQETGSLRLACQRMGISYSKGWKLVGEVESQLGFPMLERQPGGRGGGGSVITPRGRQWMERYQAFVADCKKQVQKAFDRHFGGYDE